MSKVVTETKHEKRLRSFRSLFVAREDAYAICGDDQPVAVRKPLSDEILAAHLFGEYRVGTYLIRRNGKTPFLVIDVDVPKRSLVRKILKRLRRTEVRPYVERSKSKGFHVWVFFDEQVRAAQARQFAKIALRGLDTSKIEIFPKQDEVKEGGLGNCIWLPLFGGDVAEGRTAFLDKHFAPVENQRAFLKSIHRTPRKLVTRTAHTAEPEASRSRESSKPTAGPILEGARNNALTRLAGAMRRKGATKEAIIAALNSENTERCKPPLPENELVSIAASISKYSPAEERKSRKYADEVLRILLSEGVRLFHTPDKEAYAKVKIDSHFEIWRMRDATFKRYLAQRIYKELQTVPRTQVLNDVLGSLEGNALFGGPEHDVFIRVAEEKSRIYLDLCNAAWQVVEITKHGWRVLSNSPVRFRRARGMKALCVPQPGGSITELWEFLNLASPDDFVIVLSWLVAALRPKGPYPVLVLQGEAGSAKSTAVKVLRELVDPNTAPLRSEPRDTRDLMIAARNSWCLAFDNVSHLTWGLSDDLCRLATGGGFSTRQLYTDADETVFDATRPIILNGIDAVVRRGDLLDRSLITYLPVIPEQQRRSEEQFWRLFTEAQPRLLGALLDAVSCALRRLKSVTLSRLPRMADFAQWAVAAEPTLGWPEGTFLSAYDSNRGTAVALSLEASAVVVPLKLLLAARSSWHGTAAELLRKLTKRADADALQQRNWPKNPQLLSIELRRNAPQLRTSGIDVQFGEKTSGTGSKRIIRIERKMPQESAEPEQRSKRIHRFPRLRRFPGLKHDARDACDAIKHLRRK